MLAENGKMVNASAVHKTRGSNYRRINLPTRIKSAQKDKNRDLQIDRPRVRAVS